jgi:hypothetical protein
MSVKKPKKKMLGTKNEVPSGAQMIYDIEVSDEIKKRFKDEELTESMRLLKRSKMVD